MRRGNQSATNCSQLKMKTEPNHLRARPPLDLQALDVRRAKQGLGAAKGIPYLTNRYKL
jgi:hypothetical protein